VGRDASVDLGCQLCLIFVERKANHGFDLQSGVAQRHAFFAFLCGSSPVHGVSCFVINAVVDVSMLRTAEEAKLRLPLRYLAFLIPDRLSR